MRSETGGDPPGRKKYLTAAFLSALLLGVHAAGSAAGSGSLWGVHAFGFLPAGWLPAAAAALGLVMLLCGRRDPAAPLSRLSMLAHDRPGAFLLSVALIFAATAVIQRTALPILGDGYTVLNNFRNTVAGVHPLSTSREPLAMGYFYSLATILGPAGGVAGTDAFLVGEILLAALFVSCAGLTAGAIFPGREDGRRVLLLFFVLCPPYIQLFFGYVEVYAVVLSVLSVTMLAVVLYHRGKVPFSLLPPLFALLASVHYLGLLMVPLLVDLSIREWKASGGRAVVIGALLSVPLLLPLLIWLGWDRVYITPPHSPFLPLSEISDSYTAYTIISGAHLLDVVNLLLFMGAGALIALVLGRRNSAPPEDRGLTRSLVLAVVPPLIFVCVAKFDLGMAKDWDVSAPWFYPLALLGGNRLLSGGASAIRAAVVVVAAVVVTTAAFVGLNADREGSLRRVKTLMDPSIMPQGGIYQASIHLSTAYLERREVDSMVVLWRRFIARYPDDLRGYQKLVKSMWEYGESAHGAIMDVFDLWLARAAGDTGVARQYAQFSVFAGVSSMKAGRMEEARGRFSKAMLLDPGYAPAYLQTGISHLRGGDAGSALPWLRRAAAADPRDAAALGSLVEACLMLGDTAGALNVCRDAAAAGNPRAREYLSRLGGMR